MSGCLKFIGFLTLAFIGLIFVIANLSDERTAEVKSFIGSAKNIAFSAESGYRCSDEVEAFAEKNLPSFLKKRKQLAENIRLFVSKSNELDVQSYKIQNEKARDIIKKQRDKYMEYAKRLSDQAISINYQLEEIYAISATADSKIYSGKINNIMEQMDIVLKESEDVKTDVKSMTRTEDRNAD